MLLWALAPTYPNYDSYYALVWGRELLDGSLPSFEAYAAPTQHPLWVGVGALLVLVFGDAADRALVLGTMLAHVALVLGAFRLGRAAFGAWSAALGALFVLGSASFLLYAIRGYLDPPFLALVIWAAALEAERPCARGARRPSGAAAAAPAGAATPAAAGPAPAPGGRERAVLVLLLLAGLLRPEAWVLSGGYWLWRARRPALLPLAAAAPVLWALTDLLVTGDPLRSLTATSALAEELGRERGLGAVPGAFVVNLAAMTRPPVFALALAGVALALWRPGRSRPLVPLLLVAAGALTFVATGVAGLSILPRYLTVPAVALCLLGGFALAGFTQHPEGSPVRRTWARAAAGAAVAGLAVLALLAPSLTRITEEFRFLRSSHDALQALLRDPAVTRARAACGPLTFPNYRLVPDARFMLDAPAAAVRARSDARLARGVAVFPLTPKGLERFGFADGADPTTLVPDPGYRPLARNERFAAYAAC